MTKLHSVHPKKGRGHFDLCLLVILIILLSCGLIILYSATRYTDAKEHPGQPFYTITRQVIFLAAAFVSMLFMSKAGDLFGCSFRFNAFYVKDRLS